MVTVNRINPASNRNLTTGVENKNRQDKNGTRQDNNGAYILELGNKPDKAVTYGNTAKIDVNLIKRLKKQAEDSLEPLRQLVENLLKEQGIAFRSASGELSDKMVEIGADTRAQAQEMISGDGEYSAENTAQRLVDFARALSGDDRSKLETLRAAIQEGYKEAEKAFGGQLPEISRQTLDLTMKNWMSGLAETQILKFLP